MKGGKRAGREGTDPLLQGPCYKRVEAIVVVMEGEGGNRSDLVEHRIWSGLRWQRDVDGTPSKRNSRGKDWH